MRALFLAFVLGVSSVSAAELHILTPPVIDNAGLKELAAAYTAKTGVTVTIAVDEMLKIADRTRAEPQDVVFLDSKLLAPLAQDGSASNVTPIGRVHIGLAVMAGRPHPDIATVPKLIAVLRGARAVVYSNPDPARGSLVARMVDTLLKRPEFAGVKTAISMQGNAVSGLIRGEGDMALQFETEILPRKEVELVGSLPEELGEYLDLSGAVSARAADRAGAEVFLRFVKSADAAAVWKVRGLAPK